MSFSPSPFVPSLSLSLARVRFAPFPASSRFGLKKDAPPRQPEGTYYQDPLVTPLVETLRRNAAASLGLAPRGPSGPWTCAELKSHCDRPEARRRSAGGKPLERTDARMRCMAKSRKR